MTKHRALNATIGLLVICLGGSGCGTIANLTAERPPDFYGGVTEDLATVDEGFHGMSQSCAACVSPFFGDPSSPLGGLGLVVIGIVDMPFSFVGDTLTLPYVIVKQPEEGGVAPIRHIPTVANKPLLRAQSEEMVRTWLADQQAAQVPEDRIVSIPGNQWPDSIRRLKPSDVWISPRGVWIVTSFDSLHNMYGLFVTTIDFGKGALAEEFRDFTFRKQSRGIYRWTTAKGEEPR